MALRDNLMWFILSIGIIMCLLGILLLLGKFKLLINRHEGFHRRIRRKRIQVDRERLTKFYAILYFSTGIPIVSLSIIGFVNYDIYTSISFWLWIVLAGVAIVGVIYCNVSKRFIKSDETSSETT